MNLQPINPAPAPGRMRLTCCHCHRWFDAATGYADLDGKPFVAYYCRPCSHSPIYPTLKGPAS